MGYTMKTNIPGLLGLNEEHSTLDTPVFEKNLSSKTWGYADMDRTMRRGEAWFDSNNVYHQPDKSKPINKYARIGDGMLVKNTIIPVGHAASPVEKDVYNKTKKHPVKLS